MDKSNITGAVLCGGKSTRMGREKATRLLYGKPVVEHVLNNMLRIFKKVVISSSDNSDIFTKYNLTVIHDIVKDKDSLGGIYSVLKNVETDYVFFVACDMPFIAQTAVEFMIENIGDYDIVVPRIKGKFQPLFAIYSKKCVPLIEQNLSANKLKLYDIIKAYNSKIVDENELKRYCNINKNFFNINTEEDYYKALNGNFKEAVVVAFVAKYSDSGKTTLIAEVVKEFKKRNYKIAVIKHTFHHVETDKPGKDSYRLFHAGADAVAVTSDKELFIRKRTERVIPLKYIKDRYLKEYDIIVIEGHKTGNMLKIELIKDGQTDYLFPFDDNIAAVVSNNPVETDLLLFRHGDIVKIADFIEESLM